jgi:signal transduction histidine kinase
VDDILGQVMAATTRQLNASSSALFLRNEASNHLALELVFQRNRILTPAEANYPESLGFSRFSKCGLDLAQLPAVLVNLARDQTLIADAERYHLLGLGVKTVLVIPLLVDRQLLGSLNFQFLEEREFGPEEIQIARALAAQTSLAVQFTRSAKSARQSAVLEERNRLASEIHDSLAQTFVAIAIQLNLAGGAIGPDVGKGARYLDQAKELARFGLAEARRTALCLRPFNLDKIGLIGTLEMLVERSKIPGRLSCSFSANDSRANDLPPKTQEHLFRIAQEAICNAVRHANPKVISVSLRCKRGYLELHIQDDGRGISAAEQLSQHGLGLINMQNRAKEIGARLYIHGEPGRGTAIVVRLPVNG